MSRSKKKVINLEKDTTDYSKLKTLDDLVALDLQKYRTRHPELSWDPTMPTEPKSRIICKKESIPSNGHIKKNYSLMIAINLVSLVIAIVLEETTDVPGWIVDLVGFVISLLTL